MKSKPRGCHTCGNKERHCSCIIDSDVIAQAAKSIVMESNELAADFPELSEEGRLLDAHEQLEIAKIAEALGYIKIGWKQNFVDGQQTIVIIVADTPHVIKKIVNSLERREDMQLDGCKMSLSMLEDIWRAVHFDSNGGSVLRPTKLTYAHFHRKNNVRRLCFSAPSRQSKPTLEWQNAGGIHATGIH